MSASPVAKPSPTSGLLSGKSPITEVSLVQVSSSWSEKHGDYSGDKGDFGDEPALPDTSKFSHIFEKEMQVDIPAMVPPLGEVTTTEGISSFPLNYYPIELVKIF